MLPEERAQSKMKFGQNLPRNQVPEWAGAYIDYKRLKKLIKTAERAVDQGEEPDLAGTLLNHTACAKTMH